jgi:hypothetical protein
MGPIKPSEMAQKKQEVIPDIVFETFNELITLAFRNGSAIVFQKEIADLLVERGLDRKEIFDKGWLNIEDSYKAVGWDVYYDKPAYNETYEATFKFTDATKK